MKAVVENVELETKSKRVIGGRSCKWKLKAVVENMKLETKSKE